MSNFVYQTRPAESWQSRAEQKGGSVIGVFKDKANVLTLKSKDNWVRALPPTWPGATHYGYDIWWHNYVGPQQATFLCLLKMKNGRCPSCEAFVTATAEGDENAYDYKPKRRVVAWFEDKSQPKETTPFIYAMPWQTDRDISKLCKDKQTGELYVIDHPESGYDITFDREGDPPTIVGLALARRPSAVAQSFLDFIVSNPIPDMLISKTYEECKELFYGSAEVQTTSSQPQQPQATTPLPSPVEVAQPAQVVATPLPAAALPVPAPVPVPAPAPIQPAPTFCEAAVSSGGRLIGCIYAPHDPTIQHVFERDAGPAPAPVAPTLIAAQPGPVAPPQTSGTAALRARFGTA